jgi:hypothetical protein
MLSVFLGTVVTGRTYVKMKDMRNLSRNAAGTRLKTALWPLIFAGILSPLFPASGRSVPLDVCLIIDGSEALKQGRGEAFDWLCGRIVDGLLQEGDRLTIWVAGETAEELYSGGVTGDETKETIKTLIRAIPASGRSADFSGALREAAKRETAASGINSDRLAYTLLIGGIAAGYNPLAGWEILNFLRYSRFEDFSTWRVVTAAPGIEAGVKNAAAAFMR